MSDLHSSRAAAVTGAASGMGLAVDLTCAFLCSDEAGQAIGVNGGYNM
ncbi:hypothetical protein [Nonomuraea sp. NPDC005650]